MNPYEILGIDVDATPVQVKAAFRKLAQMWHPDRNKMPEAEKRFKEINDAAEILLHTERRKAYDETGQSELPKPREIEVRNRAMSVIQQAIAGPMDDVVAAAQSIVQSKLNELTQNKQACRAGLATLQQRRENVRAKRDDVGMHLFHMVLDQAIANQEQGLEKLHVEDDLWVEVLKLLQDYESVQQMMLSQPRFHFNFTSTGSQ